MKLWKEMLSGALTEMEQLALLVRIRECFAGSYEPPLAALHNEVNFVLFIKHFCEMILNKDLLQMSE